MLHDLMIDCDIKFVDKEITSFGGLSLFFKMLGKIRCIVTNVYIVINTRYDYLVSFIYTTPFLFLFTIIDITKITLCFLCIYIAKWG